MIRTHSHEYAPPALQIPSVSITAQARIVFEKNLLPRLGSGRRPDRASSALTMHRAPSSSRRPPPFVPLSFRLGIFYSLAPSPYCPVAVHIRSASTARFAAYCMHYADIIQRWLVHYGRSSRAKRLHASRSVVFRMVPCMRAWCY